MNTLRRNSRVGKSRTWGLDWKMLPKNPHLEPCNLDSAPSFDVLNHYQMMDRQMLRAAIPLPALPEKQDFSAESDRARLSRVALKAYRRLVEHWGLTGHQAAALLDVSTSTWERLKQKRKDKSLSQDQLTRISAMVGIYKGLHLLFADDMADRWPKLDNKGPLFARMSPIDSMLKGGIPQMLEVRRYVDAVRGGL